MQAELTIDGECGEEFVTIQVIDDVGLIRDNNHV